MVTSQFNSLGLGVYQSRVDITGTKNHSHGTWTPLHTTLAAVGRFIGQDAAATAEPHLLKTVARFGKKQVKTIQYPC